MVRVLTELELLLPFVASLKASANSLYVSMLATSSAISNWCFAYLLCRRARSELLLQNLGVTWWQCMFCDILWAQKYRWFWTSFCSFLNTTIHGTRKENAFPPLFHIYLMHPVVFDIEMYDSLCLSFTFKVLLYNFKAFLFDINAISKPHHKMVFWYGCNCWIQQRAQRHW